MLIPWSHIESFFLTKAFLFSSIYELHDEQIFATMYHYDLNIKKDPYADLAYSLTNQRV